MAYKLYEDEELLKRQGGVAKGGLVSDAAETLGRIAVAPANIAANNADIAWRANPINLASKGLSTITKDAAAQKDAQAGFTEGNLRLASEAAKLKTGLAAGNPPWTPQVPQAPQATTPLVNQAVPTIAKPVVAPIKDPAYKDPNVFEDPRFEAMRLGKAGEKAPAQGPQAFASRVPGSGSIRDEQTGEVVSIGPSGEMQRTNSAGQPIDKLSDRSHMTQDPLSTRQLGQPVKYNKGGLSVEFAGSTPTSEISAFTGSHRGLVGAREQQEAARAKQALISASQPPPPPEEPTFNVNEPNLNEIKAKVYAQKMDAYQAKYGVDRTASTAAEKNAIDREGMVGQKALHAQQGISAQQLASQNEEETRLMSIAGDPSVPEATRQIARQALGRDSNNQKKTVIPGTPGYPGLPNSGTPTTIVDPDAGTATPVTVAGQVAPAGKMMSKEQALAMLKAGTVTQAQYDKYYKDAK